MTVQDELFPENVAIRWLRFKLNGYGQPHKIGVRLRFERVRNRKYILVVIVICTNI